MNSLSESRGRNRALFRVLRSGLAFLLMALALTAFPAFAAGSFLVTSTNDSGGGSLRQAILDANAGGGGDISFSNVTGTITLLSPLPSLAANITIAGPGTNLLTISGNNQVSIFWMSAGTTNLLSGLTIAGGMVTNSWTSTNYWSPVGAGILNSGSLRLLNCVIRGCTLQGAHSSGGGIYNTGNLLMQRSHVVDCAAVGDDPYGWDSSGGGICNYGNLRMEDCAVLRCAAGDAGGIVSGTILIGASLVLTNCTIASCSAWGRESAAGGISAGTLTMHSCVVSNCDASWGGGIASHNLAMTNSTITANIAYFQGGGLVFGQTNILVGCTICGNVAPNGGGILEDPWSSGDNEVKMLNCTVSGNSAYQGEAAIEGDGYYLNHCTIVSNLTTRPYGGAGGVSGTIQAQNSIFAGNGSNDISGTLISEGYNLIQNTNGCTIAGDQTGNLYGAVPLVGPLQDNGGPTWTCALLPGSPAINAGTSAGASDTDQRGVPRPQGAAADIGAFEYALAPVHYVDCSNPNPVPPYATWATASTTIQSAISFAKDGEAVLVRRGSYRENISFQGKALTISSESGPAVTLIDGGHAGSVVTFAGGEGTGASLQGFTLTNGYAAQGGGIYCTNASPVISNCVVVGNSTWSGTNNYNYPGGPGGNGGEGGGIYASSNSLPTIASSTIAGNTAGAGGDGLPCGSGGNGGGIYCYSAAIAKSTIISNYAGDVLSGPLPIGDDQVGTDGGDGGGIYCNSATISDSLIVGNSTGCGENIALGTGHVGGNGGRGGGLFTWGSSKVERCTFSQNTTGYGGGCEYTSGSGGDGGGVYASGGMPVFRECYFLGNTTANGTGYDDRGGSGGNGAGLCAEASCSPVVSACLFSANATGGGGYAMSPWTFPTFGGDGGSGGGVFCYGGVFSDCIFQANTTGNGGTADGGTKLWFSSAGEGGSGGWGAGICSRGAIITSCLLANNSTGRGGNGLIGGPGWSSAPSAGNGGSGSGCYSVYGTVANCTFWGNTLGSGGSVDAFPMNTPGTNGIGGAIWSSNTTVVNCILWNNAGSEIAGSGFQISHSDIRGGTGQPWFNSANCLDANPQLVNPEAGDFHLSSFSPCIDEGLNQPWMSGTTDLDGNARILASAVDMGAWESYSSTGPQYPQPTLTGMAFQPGTNPSVGTNLWLQARGTPGATCTLQVSSNLVQWANSTTASLGPDGLWDFIDQDCRRFPLRFYRLAQWPAGTVYAPITPEMLTGPFVFTNDYAFQPIQTDTPSEGGSAVWSFSVGKAGTYVIQATVNAPGDHANTFFANVDAEPTAPYMIWDIPLTSGFEQRTVSWRGNGTYDHDEFVPKVFTLSAGSHQLIVRGREANTLLQNLAVVPIPFAPDISAISQDVPDVDPNTMGIQVYPGTTAHYSAMASDPNGQPLTWQWSCVVDGGAETSVQGGTGIVAPVTFTYGPASAGRTYVWRLRVSNNQAASQTQLTVAIPGWPLIETTNGVIAAPFVVTSNYISQPVQTTEVTNSGRAAYTFKLNTAGAYIINALVDAPSDNANTFFANIDAEPESPSMIWDIPLTSGFEQRTVSWRGAGTFDTNQFIPKVFNLVEGTHELIVRGREANAKLQQLMLQPYPAVYLRATNTYIYSPFVISNDSIHQPIETTAVTNGGYAAFSFKLTNGGTYILQATVNAPGDNANTFFVNIDAQPTDPDMIWDIPLTSGFQERVVSWRGSGTYDNNEFVPKVFNLSAGSHYIIIRGREANTFLRDISVLPYP